jgi:PPM family protein phosphatase
MRTVVAAGTDIGRVRDGNEDAFLVDAPLFAVADGMGGHRGGEVASSLALETLEAVFALRQGTLGDQVREANRAVFERSVNDRAVAGMGTTLTAILLEDDRLRLAHVGDSRAYLVRQGDLRRLTEDHTLVHRMVLEGDLTAEEAELHPHRNILTRVLGVDPDLELDEDLVDLRPGDRILLCSDGLTGMLSEDRIARVLAEEPEPAGAVERLIRESNEAGGIDNITAVIVDLAREEGTDTAPESTAQAGAGAPPHEGADRTTFADSAEPSGTAERASRSGERASRAAAGAPARPPRARLGARRPVVWAALALGVLVLGVVGFRLYLDAQWYVGISHGRVAIYRGIPTSVAGFDLHRAVEETDIPSTRAEALALYHDLQEGITANDRAAAEAIVEQIRADVVRAGGTTPSPPVSTAPPTPSGTGAA